MIHTKHATSQEAWEFINEFLVKHEEEIKDTGGYRSGPLVSSYDHFMEINKAWVNPDFDFGDVFGYRIQKWSKLISNYIDFNYLDIAKSQVIEKEKKKSPHYSVAWKFANTQESGHACLVSLVFCRRYKQPNPIIIVTIRSSEVTKRLLMDFLLVERIIEYIYGKDHSASIKLYCSNMWLSGEAFTMYHRYKGLNQDWYHNNDNGISKKILGILEKFLDKESLNMAYKVHLRAVKRLHNLPIKPLKVKDLKL